MGSLNIFATRRSKAPRTIAELNQQRILNPPRPSLGQWSREAWYLVEEWWRRHVNQRELYRRLDAMSRTFRAQFPPEWDTPEYASERLRRLGERLACEQPRGVVPFEVPLEDYLLDPPPSRRLRP